MGITDGTLNTLVTELVTLAEEKNKLKISSTENNPFYATIETNITTTKKALIEQIKNSLNLAQISQKDINKRISESEAVVNKLPGTEKDLFTIQRKFNLSDQTYSFLLEKRAEASISKASNLSNNMILDPAEIGEKVHPKTLIIYLIALLLGILLPYIIIRLQEYFNDTIQSKNDIESQSNLTIIGTIAHSKYQTSLVVIDKPRSMVSETIRSVKANMDFVGTKGSNIISLTSTIGGEGKTYCSINISSSFAISDKKTVLIGADLRKPKIFNDFNITNDKGLTSYLIGKCDLDDIINETQVKNLHIITAGPIPPNPAELLSSEKMKELLQELRKIYDYIIIDTPPLGIVTDALFLMRHSDINIYVTRFNYTSKKVIKDVNDMVKTTGVKNVCFLLNDIMFNEGRYGKYGQYSNKYGYTYTYHKGYYEED
jgi:capsular exopolysaccharide synthesis family protein